MAFPSFSFAQNPDDPEGLVTVTDPQTGQSRLVYDPAGTLRASLMARHPREAPPVPVAEPEGPLGTQEHLRTEGPPAPPAAPLALPPAGADPEPSDLGPVNPPQRPVVRASGAPPPIVRPQGLDPNLVQSKVKVEPGTPGYTYDKAAEEQRGADLLERTLELDRRQQAADLILGEQQIEKERLKAEEAKREAINAEKSARYERELEQVVKKEINPDRIKQNQSVGGSILGIVGQALGMLSLPGSGVYRWQEQVQSSLDKRIERDIAAQKEEKDSTINLLTKQLGNAQQAENHYRAQVTAYTADIMESRLKRLGLENQYTDQIQGLRDTAMAYNEQAKTASFGKPGTVETTWEQPKPVKGAGPARPLPVWDEELKALGISHDDYDRGLAFKTESGLTIGQETNAVKALDADELAIRSLMAQNGGDLQGQELVQVPQAFSTALAAMGVGSHLKREQANQMIQRHLIERAKSYGGALTAADLAAVQGEMGTTEEGYLSFLAQQRDKHNQALRLGASQYFKKNSQAVINKLLRDTSATTGVPKVEAAPFGKKNAPAPPKEERELSDVEKKQAENRGRVKKSVGDFFSGFDPIAPPPSRGYRGYQ